MSSWRECKLGDVAEIIDSLHKTPKEYFTTGYPMVRVTDVKRGKLNLSQTLKVNKETFEEFSKKYKPKKDDIIFTRVGSYGNTCIVGDDINFCLGQNTVFIIPRENAKFLYYFFNSPDAKVQIEASVSGSTQPTVSLKSIREYDISLPPLKEQKAIAEILSSLDDKIDLLHRQNQTLESLAQTLFRQWFIEEAKEEWEDTSLFDIIILVGGGTPKTMVAEYWDGNIGWLAGGDISSHHKGFISKTEKTITQTGLEKSSAKLLPKYATVISARGTVGKYCLLAEPMTFSQSNYGVLPKFEDCYFFIYLLISHSVEELQAAAYGSVFDTITTKTFQEHNITLPDEKIVKEFEEEIKPYFTKIESNTKQIQTLENLRDTLLPKLLNGEVRVEI